MSLTGSAATRSLRVYCGARRKRCPLSSGLIGLCRGTRPKGASRLPFTQVIDIHTLTDKHMHAHTHARMHIYTLAHTHAHTHTHTHTHTYTHTYTQTHARTHTHIHTRTHTRTRTHIRIRMHMYEQTHAHTHALYLQSQKHQIINSNRCNISSCI